MPRGKVQPQIAQFAQSILDAVNLAITQRLNRAGIADTQINAGSLSGSAGPGFAVNASQVSGGVPGTSPEPAHTVLAGPVSGVDADPTFRELVAADLVAVLTAKGDLLSFGSGPTRLAVGVDGTLLAADSTQAAGLKWVSPASVASGPLSDDAAIGLTDDGGASLFDDSSPGGGGGSGTVTSVGLSLPADFSVTGSPVTGSGTLTATRTTQSPNLVLAGPASGAAAAPAYRALVGADLPATLTVSQGTPSSSSQALTTSYALIAGCSLSLVAGSYLVSANITCSSLTSGDLTGGDIYNSTDAAHICGSNVDAALSGVSNLGIPPFQVVLTATKTIQLRAVNDQAARGAVQQLNPDGSGTPCTWLTAVRYA
ncbi:MAG TPA: hypothetical protein VIU62_16115 [Chloroflexota bacterium]|jgi:hypothetical protein